LTRLHERWPALSGSLPHLALGDGPTPVRRLEALESAGCETWVKDDGVYGSVYGGNKVRKLEWILPDAKARGRRTIVTVGALATNHGLATALYAREHGLRCVIALVDQPLDDEVRRKLERIRRTGARLYFTHGTYRTYAAAPWIMLRNADLRRLRLPYFLTVGGSSPLGCVGFVEAGLELGEQVRAGELPEPSHVVVALGSGGTTAGLAAGLRLAGLRTRVTGVVVNDRMPIDQRVVARLANRTLDLLRRRGARIPGLTIAPRDVESPTDWLGAGYGHRTAEAERARALALERERLALDPVYTAKAFAGLLALRERGAFGDGPVLYWHTHDALGERDDQPDRAHGSADRASNLVH
jgi:D-cysteine desulfhydrase